MNTLVKLATFVLFISNLVSCMAPPPPPRHMMGSGQMRQGQNQMVGQQRRPQQMMTQQRSVSAQTPIIAIVGGRQCTFVNGEWCPIVSGGNSSQQMIRTSTSSNTNTGYSGPLRTPRQIVEQGGTPAAYGRNFGDPNGY